MTMPSMSDPNQMPDAINAQGIAGVTTTAPAARMQGMFNQIGGPLGALGEWLIGGIAESVLADAEEASTEGTVPSQTNAAEKVFGHIGSLASTVTSPLEMLSSALTGAGGGVLDGPLGVIASFMGGKWEAVDDLEDGQNALRDRMDLVEEISGYCNSYVSANTSVSKRTVGEDPAYLPIANPPVGPFKNAHVGTYAHPSRGAISGVWIDAWGTWQIDSLVTSAAAVMIGSTYMAAGVDVWDTQTHALYSRKASLSPLTSGIAASRDVHHSVVIPEGGRYFVCLPVWHSIAGGSMVFVGSDTWTGLSVNRVDIRTDGELNPPPTELE